MNHTIGTRPSSHDGTRWGREERRGRMTLLVSHATASVAPSRFCLSAFCDIERGGVGEFDACLGVDIQAARPALFGKRFGIDEGAHDDISLAAKALLDCLGFRSPFTERVGELVAIGHDPADGVVIFEIVPDEADNSGDVRVDALICALECSARRESHLRWRITGNSAWLLPFLQQGCSHHQCRVADCPARLGHGAEPRGCVLQSHEEAGNV